MTLTFDPGDLRPECQNREDSGVHQNIPTSQVTFEHLNDHAQAALRIVGRGTFYDWSKKTYNAVYPPK